MLIRISGVLDPDTVEEFRQTLEQAQWEDGRGSAGYLSRQVKDNGQLPDGHPVARALGERVLAALDGNELFNAAALPARIVPPLFNRYAGAQTYGRHVDGAIRPVSGTPLRVRTDLSATLFLTPAEDYDGGELVIEDTGGPVRAKLPAGDLVLYPANRVHRVEPVTRGVRLASFFWIQSLVRSETRRGILFELDRAIQKVARSDPGHESLVDLAGVYHNLLREWADA